MPLCSAPKFVKVNIRQKGPMKRFHNGHKTFSSAEATAIYELQTHEKHRRENFEKNKDKLVAFRNPLTGEETPREGQEMLIMEAYDQSRTRNYEDVSLKTTGKIGFDGIPKSEKIMDRVTSLQSRKQQIDAELNKANEILMMRESKLSDSIHRNRLNLKDESYI